MSKLCILILFSLYSFTLASSELSLVGTGLAEYSIFKIDIYQISYYRSKSGLEEMILDYKTDVKKKYSIMGWNEGLAAIIKNNPKYKKKYAWIISQVVDLKKGDKYTIRRQNDVVTMLKNDKLIGKIKDFIISSLVFEPWIGKKTVDQDLKRKLLKNDKEF